jgi:RNA polymerase subunit RPABC4/transcription elongation factor Spt4
MKYCNRCHKLTLGEPVFCNYCGSSYGIKLCGRLHSNPRSAQACSQCGSRDFSNPHPKIPIILRPFVALLHILPKLIGSTLFIGAIYVAVYSVVHDPRFIQGLGCLLFLVFVGAVLWKLLPKWLQGFLKTTFQLIAFLLNAVVRLFFSKNREGKRARYRM